MNRPSLLRRAWNALFRIQTRFLAVHLLLVAVPVAGINFARFYEREMLRSLEEDMIHQAEVLRQTLLQDPSGVRLEARAPLLRVISKDTRARIRLVSSEGRLIADSDPTSTFPETDADADVPYLRMIRSGAFPATTALHTRVEVRQAMRGKYGSHMRFGKDTNLLFLCSALPIVDVSGKVLGIVYVLSLIHI